MPPTAAAAAATSSSSRSLLLTTAGGAAAGGGAGEEHELCGRAANGLLFLSVLGRGAYGVVLRAKELTSAAEYAVKVMSRSQLRSKKEWVREGRGLKLTTALDKIKRELAITAMVQHRNVIKCFFVIDDELSDQIFLILELLRGGNAMTFVDAPSPPAARSGDGSGGEGSGGDGSGGSDGGDDDAPTPPTRSLAGRYMLLGPPPTLAPPPLPAGAPPAHVGAGTLSMSQCRRVVRDVLRGLAYLHSNAIVHRDIKPENILLTGPRAAVAAAAVPASGGSHQLATSTDATVAPPALDAVDAELDACPLVAAIGRALLADLGVGACAWGGAAHGVGRGMGRRRDAEAGLHARSRPCWVRLL